MKRIILDTDIGVDCDDAVALAMLIGFAKSGHCSIEAITTSTTRRGAVASVRAICDYYNYSVKVGQMRQPALACDRMNSYAAELMERYRASDVASDGVALIRRVLAESEEKVTLVSIGPFTNIRRLLESEGDEFSPLGGAELVAEKVDEMYSMGCCFGEDVPEYAAVREWNVNQDIPAAEFVFRNFPAPIVFSPGETGGRIFIGETLYEEEDNPAARSISLFHEKESGRALKVRESWDPVTCFVAVRGEDGLFSFSPWGDVEISEDGLTSFRPCGNGTRRYIRPAIPETEIERALESYLRVPR